MSAELRITASAGASLAGRRGADGVAGRRFLSSSDPARGTVAQEHLMSILHCTIGLASLLLAAAAHAQGSCLDQSYVPNPPTNGLEITASQPVTQTFTVGRTGQLTHIEIALINHHRGTPSQPLQVDVVVTDPAGVPTTVALASFTLQPSSVPSARGPLLLDLQPFNIQVTSGLVLGLSLSSAATPGSQTYAWWGEAPGGAYAGGQVYIQQTVALSAWDLAFRTWVAPPASWTSYGAGHAGTNGIPSLTASANPVLGTAPVVQMGNSSGTTTFGGLFFGFLRANQPTPFGGTALVQYIASITLSVAPAGVQFALGIPNDPDLCGLVVDLQAALLDPGASQGIAFTPGLEFVLGG